MKIGVEKMKWQWKLGRFAGIDVYVHATFLLLIGWGGYSHWVPKQGVGGAVGGVAALEPLPDKPIEELWVALMGPAVNVLIPAGLFAYLFFRRGLVPLNE